MKKLNIIMLLVGLLMIVACNDDNDSNPTFREPTTFVLNTPKFASGIYDLRNTQSIQLTCSQPDYGFTAATTYRVQISLKRDFEEGTYTTLFDSFTSALIEADASEIAVALSEMLGYPDEESYPTDTIFPVFVRLEAALSNSGMGRILSNVVELPHVKSYFALPPVNLPENFYLIGNVAGNWEWAKSTTMVPVHSNPGMFWAIQYLGTDDGGNNAEIKFNAAHSWDGAFGINNVTIDSKSVADAGISGTDNIVIGNPGWYLVVATVTLAGRDYNVSLQFLPPHIYLTGNTSGGWDTFDEARLFTVPAGKGEFVSPAFVASDELRMCVKLQDIDWWKTEFIILGGKIEYRGIGGDQERVTVSTGQKAYLNFIDGTGQVR